MAESSHNSSRGGTEDAAGPERLPWEGSAPGKRLLIVKLGAIGDVVMAIPAAAAMHAAGYTVAWVAGDVVAPVLRLYPFLNVIAVNESRLLRSKVTERSTGILRLWQELRKLVRKEGAFDLIATLYYDPRYQLLALPLRAKRKVALSHRDRSLSLLAGRHHTDEYARILTAASDGENPAQLSPVQVPSLPPSPRPLHPRRPRVVLVPAGARNLLRDDALRRWPIDAYVMLAGMLLEQGCEVVLAGGPEDRWATKHFEALAAGWGDDSFANLIGRFSLVETLALLDSAAVSVTHDTGPLHLAGITSTGIVTIFGPTDPHGRLPQRANVVALWGGFGFACRPCYDGRNYASCSHNGCMAQVTPAMVLEQVKVLLGAREEGRSLPPRVLAPEHTALIQIQETAR